MLSGLDTLLSRIDEKIIANLKFSNESNFTLYNGNLGKLLYLNERIKHIKSPLIENAYKDLLINKFSQIINGQDFLYYKSSLMYGAGGVLYTYNQFVESGLIETNKELEQNFRSYILSNLNLFDIDIFHGFTGGFISLNSFSKKSLINNVEFAKSFIHYINDNLSQDVNNIYTWKHVKNGIKNIGTAHGLPNLNLIAGYGSNQSAPILNSAYQNVLTQQNATIGIAVPLFSSGANTASFRIAEYQLQNQKLQLEQRITSEVMSQIHTYNMAIEQISNAQFADSIAQRRYVISFNKYQVGKITYTDLLLAQNQQLQAKQSYLNAIASYWQAYYQLRVTTLYDIIKQEALLIN